MPLSRCRAWQPLRRRRGGARSDRAHPADDRGHGARTRGLRQWLPLHRRRRPWPSPADCRFDDAILAEHAVSNRSRWDADYAAFARAKAQLAWRSGLDGRTVQDARPHLLRHGETLLAGAVQLDGIVVGVSRRQPWYDEAFANCVAAQLRAIARRRHAEAREAGALFAGDGASA